MFACNRCRIKPVKTRYEIIRHVEEQHGGFGFWCNMCDHPYNRLGKHSRCKASTTDMVAFHRPTGISGPQAQAKLEEFSRVELPHCWRAIPYSKEDLNSNAPVPPPPTAYTVQQPLAGYIDQALNGNLHVHVPSKNVKGTNSSHSIMPVQKPVDPPLSNETYIDDFTGTGDIDVQLIEPISMKEDPPKPDLKGVEFEPPVRSYSPNSKFNRDFSCSSSSVSSISFSSDSSSSDSESEMETSSNNFDKDSRQVKIRKRKHSQDSGLSITNPKIQKSTPHDSDKKKSVQKTVNKEKHENKNTMNKDSVQKDKDRKVKEVKEKTKISLETYRKKESEKKADEESKKEKERKMHASQEKSESKTGIEKKVNKETENRTVKETKNEKTENRLEMHRMKESERKINENSEKGKEGKMNVKQKTNVKVEIENKKASEKKTNEESEKKTNEESKKEKERKTNEGKKEENNIKVEERNNEFEIPNESFRRKIEDNWSRNTYYNILRAISAMQHSSSTPYQERKEEHNPMTNLGYKQLSVLQEVQENQIKLNIGGKIFLTSKVTLQAEPNSLFGMLFRKSCPMRPINGDTYNFDRNPRYFEFLLDYLRNGGHLDLMVLPREKGALLALLAEARFFMLFGLEKIILDRCQLEFNSRQY